MGVTSGKWYFEYYVQNSGSINHVGIKSPVLSAGNMEDALLLKETGVTILNDGSEAAGGVAFTTGDIIGVALNADDDEISWYKNGIIMSGLTDFDYSSLTHKSAGVHPAVRDNNGSLSVLNFGQDSSFANSNLAPNAVEQGYQDSNGIGDFYYEPPSGFLALCTKNLPEPTVTPSEHFNTVLYSGTGSSNSITGVGFQPDWIWIKGRDVSVNNFLFDAVRGVSKYLRSDITNAEGTSSGPRHLTAFGSDGFTVGVDNDVNNSGEGFVAWNWKAGTSFSNDASATSVGSIDSAGSVNTAAGFSVIGYTGTGTTGTVAHGLAGVPEMYIVKNRDAADNWATYFEVLGNDKRVALDTTAVVQDTNNWDSTSPSSTVFTVKGGENRVNDSNEKYISYHFRSIDGYSKVGSYVGNDNADGMFVYCGFKPAFVLIKNTNNNGEGFVMFNNKSDPDNVVGTYLTAYGSTAEQGTTSVTHSRSMDLVSNGFKLRGNSTEINDSETIVFYAVAERPFKYSHAG
jgi:hypothetical protein